MKIPVFPVYAGPAPWRGALELSERTWKAFRAGSLGQDKAGADEKGFPFRPPAYPPPLFKPPLERSAQTGR